MIAQLNGHITEAQLDVIKTTIQNQYAQYKRMTGLPEFQNLFRSEYGAHRKRHSVSWAINSAFVSGTIIADNLTIKIDSDMGGHVRPVLENDRIIVHVLNESTNFQANYYQDFYAVNDFERNPDKLYCYIKYKESHDMEKLTEVVLCLPNQNGTVVAEEVLLSKAILKLVA